MSKKIKDAFADAIKARQRVWSHDRTKSLGASETFACIRRGWFAKHRADLKEEQDLGAAERGNIMERHHVVPALQHIYGADNCLYMSEDQDTLVLDRSSATPDGLVINQPRDVFSADGLADIESDCFACEIKSFDPRAHIDEEKAIHRGQTIMQLGMYRKLGDYRPEFAVILYVNASIYTDVRPFFVRYDEATYLNGLKRGRLIFETKDPYDLFAEGALSDECKHCPFVKACNDAEIKHFPSGEENMSADDRETLRALTEMYLVGKKKKTEGTAEVAEAAEHIKNKLSAVNCRKVDDEIATISYSKSKGQKALDKVKLSAFLKEHGKTMEDFQDGGNPYTRLVVTEKIQS